MALRRVFVYRDASFAPAVMGTYEGKGEEETGGKDRQE